MLRKILDFYETVRKIRKGFRKWFREYGFIIIFASLFLVMLILSRFV